MSDKTEIEKVREAKDFIFQQRYYSVGCSDTSYSGETELYGAAQKALQEKLERLENSLPPAPKQGDK